MAFIHKATWDDGKTSSVVMTESTSTALVKFLASLNDAARSEMLNVLHNARVFHKNDLSERILAMKAEKEAKKASKKAPATSPSLASPSTPSLASPSAPSPAPSEATMCVATLKDGSPCKFKAKAGSSYCGRHQPKA